MRKTEELQKRQYDTAIKIALDAGVLVQCEIHTDGVFSGIVNLPEVYTLGNEHYSKGKLEGVFSLRRELLEFLEVVIPKYRTEQCPYCANNSDSK